MKHSLRLPLRPIPCVPIWRRPSARYSSCPKIAHNLAVQRRNSRFDVVHWYARRSTLFSQVRRLTKKPWRMFPPDLHSLMGENKTGACSSGACWTATGATTDQSVKKAWSRPRRGTSLTSTSATSSPAGSGIRASGRCTLAAERWVYCSRLKLRISEGYRTTRSLNLARSSRQGCALRYCWRLMCRTHAVAGTRFAATGASARPLRKPTRSHRARPPKRASLGPARRRLARRGEVAAWGR
jgi:hypothetical protein